MSRARPIHRSIKSVLGYEPEQPDVEVLKDWRKRTGRICKPCWELKYCPYGPLVEQSPLLPSTRAGIEASHPYRKRVLETGMLGEAREITNKERKKLEKELDDEQLLLHRAVFDVRQEIRLEQAAQADDPVSAFLDNGPLPPIEVYRVSFDVLSSGKIELSNYPVEIRKRIRVALRKERNRLKQALKTGILDDRKPIDEIRRTWFENELSNYDPEDYPEEIPAIFSEASCNIFGHICPVFFAAESITETEQQRRRGRYIPFKIKIRVVRRDNYTCQHCGVHLRDDEVEFDHIIPVAKGGSSEEHNIRLTCFDCNRDKSDSVAI